MTPAQILGLRYRLDMTQEEFARALGFATRGAVCKLERGGKVASGTTLALLQLVDSLSQKKPKEISRLLLTLGNTAVR